MKLTVCVAALLVGSLLPVRAQQPAPKPSDHMQHRFDDPAKFAKSFDDPEARCVADARSGHRGARVEA